MHLINNTVMQFSFEAIYVAIVLKRVKSSNVNRPNVAVLAT